MDCLTRIQLYRWLWKEVDKNLFHKYGMYYCQLAKRTQLDPILCPKSFLFSIQLQPSILQEVQRGQSVRLDHNHQTLLMSRMKVYSQQ